MAEEEPVINHMLSPNEMLNKALILRGYTARRLRRVKPKTNVFRFKHHFGVSPCTAARVYSDLQSTADEEYKMEGGERDLKYFVMALYYIRKYPTEEDLSASFDFSSKWAREKTWEAIKKIWHLKHKMIWWKTIKWKVGGESE